MVILELILNRLEKRTSSAFSEWLHEKGSMLRPLFEC
jgi:hypothetical protein